MSTTERDIVDVHEDDGLLSSVELARAAGITYRQADYWTRLGALQPSEPARGSGTHRRYNRTEREIARALGRLDDLWSHDRSPVLAVSAAIRRSERRFELIPGVTVDLDRLLA